MLGGLLLALLLAGICSVIFSVFSASLKWAQDIGETIRRENEKERRRFSGRCATCGVDFLESRQVEDGTCADCLRPLCSPCAAPRPPGSLRSWRCPFCYKKRFESYEGADALGRRRTSLSSIFHDVVNSKEEDSSTDSWSKWSQGTSGYDSSISGKSFIQTKFPGFSLDLANGWSSDYESDTGKSTQTETWEDNWLFKKKLSTTVHLQPLAMFVPKPNKVSKARIGGTDVDDLSDLSDYSDSELEDIINK